MRKIAEDPIDFTVCERENLARCGEIQPHGAFVALDSESGCPQAWSVNCDSLIGIKPEPNIRLKLSPEEVDALTTIESGERQGLLVRKVRRNAKGIAFDLSLHKISEGLIAMEWEPSANRRPSLGNDLYAPKTMETEQLRAWIRSICTTLGMNRGLLYKFQPDKSGLVEAAWAEDDLETYEGLRYPATDIPLNARKLYMNIASRHIGNSFADSVPIRSSEPNTRVAIDLSRAELRSVSPFHLAYMRNMGVGTSISLPIVIDRQLWALLTFHRLSSEPVDLVTRQLLEQSASDIRELIAFSRIEKRMQIIDRKQRIIKTLTSAATDDGDSPQVHRAAEELIKVLNCDGFAALSPKETLCVGKTPNLDEIRSMSRKVAANHFSGTFVTDASGLTVNEVNLSDFPGVATAWCSLENGLGAIMLFRQESTQTVVWGSRTEIPSGGLNPAASFSRWQESMRGHSLPWDEDIFPWLKAFQLALQRTSLKP